MLPLRIESFPDAALGDDRFGADSLPSRGITVAAADPFVLASIHRHGVNLAIFHRPLPRGVSAASLQSLLSVAPFTLTASGPPETVATQIAKRAPALVPAPLLEDMADLAAFFEILDDQSGTVRVRLEALDHNGCSRWHADAVGLRLLCTYCGPGTQWLSMVGGAPAARAMGREPPKQAVQHIPAGAVAVLKGEAYPDNAENGCIHRSPPAGGRVRLLLCIDQPRWDLEE